MTSSGSSPTVDPHVRPLHLRGAHVHHHLRGRTHGRLRRHLVLVIFIVGLSLSVGIGAVVVALAAPGSQPLCRPYSPCAPPAPSLPLVNQTVWHSSEFGFRLEYPGALLSASSQTAGGLTLGIDVGNADGTIVVRGRPASQATPPQAITSDLASLPGISQLSADTSRSGQLLGPAVGYRAGVGGVYTGYQTAAQGVGGQQTVYAEAATDGHVTVSVLAIAPSSDAGPKSDIAEFADIVVNSIRWQ